MKKLFPALFPALILAASACSGDDLSKDIELEKKNSDEMLLSVVSVISKSEEIEIRDVEVNHGQCEVDKPYGVKLSYGERYNINAVLCDPIYVKIETDKGSGEWEFDPR